MVYYADLPIMTIDDHHYFRFQSFLFCVYSIFNFFGFNIKLIKILHLHTKILST